MEEKVANNLLQEHHHKDKEVKVQALKCHKVNNTKVIIKVVNQDNNKIVGVTKVSNINRNLKKWLTTHLTG